jgi:hypothetical protein
MGAIKLLKLAQHRTTRKWTKPLNRRGVRQFAGRCVQIFAQRAIYSPRKKKKERKI